MADVTYARAQSATIEFGDGGTFTPTEFETNAVWHSYKWIVGTPVWDVTGAQNGTADTTKFFIDGMPTLGGIAIGTPFEDTDNLYGRSVNLDGTVSSTFTAFATLNFKAFDWIIEKRWPRFDVTGVQSSVADTSKDWFWGMPEYSGSVRGVINTASSPGLAITGTNGVLDQVAVRNKLITNINQVGTLTCDDGGAYTSTGTRGAFFRRTAVDAPIRTGGPIPVAFEYVLSGQVAYTAAGAGEEWHLDSADVNPPAGTLTIKTDDGVTVSHEAKIFALRFVVSPQSSRPVTVLAEWYFDYKAA